jgi:hypothetical protein
MPRGTRASHPHLYLTVYVKRRPLAIWQRDLTRVGRRWLLPLTALATDVPPPVPTRDDDELDELPPMDGDASDLGENAPAAEDDDVPGPAPSEGDLDDATGEDDPADASELDIDEADGDWLGEAQDAADLELGEDDSLELRDEGTSFVEAEEP